MDNKKVSEITQAVYSGSLADKIKKNASYTIMGVIIGGAVGAIVAGFLGKGKMMGAVVGAVVFGIGGKVMANSKTE